jgi:hemoglobin-like flavoprotein
VQKETVRIVQETWEQVETIAPQAAALFYRNLFEADPGLRRLFKTDMELQGKKLMQMIGVAVRSLRTEQALIPVLQALGRRHGGYGVLPSHYATVGAALISTLRAGLGEAFTPEVEKAWGDLYALISDVMIAAAEEEEAVRLTA